MRYEIRIEGVLDEHWSSWFDGLQITNQGEGVTVIAGPSPTRRRCMACWRRSETLAFRWSVDLLRSGTKFP